MDPRQVFPFSTLSAVPPAHYLPKSFPLMIFADPHPLNPVASIFYKNIGGGGHLQFSIPYHLFLITYPLFFHILAHSFPLAKNSTLLFSGASALFAKSHPGWGSTATPACFVLRGEGTTLIQSLNKQTRFASGDTVKKAIAQRADRYFGEPPVFAMTKNYLQVAVEIAQEAGKILIEELSRPLDIAYKGDEVDLVTQADKRSERLIVERLTKYFPDHAIAAEEGTGHESASASEFRWHVDPLDGTTNFAHGYPCFCVSIALAQRDTLLAAAVFNPFYHELFTAARGEGATFNGKKIHVSKVTTLSTSLLCTGFPVRNRKASPNLQYYGDFTQHSHGVRRDGSAALDLASVAASRFDGFWEFGLQKWDTAAGVLLVEEAGGKVSDFAGNPYQLGGPVILATNGLIHEEMRAMALEISRRALPAPAHSAANP